MIATSWYAIKYCWATNGNKAKLKMSEDISYQQRKDTECNGNKTNQMKVQFVACLCFLQPYIYNSSEEIGQVQTGMTLWDALLSYTPSSCNMS